MKFPGKRKLITTLMLSTLLTACGGGGGGGGDGSDDDNDDRGAQPTPLTTLPAFLQGHETECQAMEGSNTASLVDYRGSLANITELHCSGVNLTSLSGVEQLSALLVLELPNTSLTTVDDLLALATQLKSLNVGENNLANLTTISQLTALENLDLSGMGIGDISALANLLALKELDLSNNTVTDLSALTALQNLEQVFLNGNTDLDCNDVNSYSQTLAAINADSTVTPPAHCTTALFLNADSPESQVINNSSLDPRYGTLYIGAGFTTDDLVLRKSSDDLTLTLNTDQGERSITFTGWYLGRDNQIGTFLITGDGEYVFHELREHVELVESLTETSDEYMGTTNDDVIYGAGGDDSLEGNWGDDSLNGGPGNDFLEGGLGFDTLVGGIGNDILRGGTQTDHLTGGPGNDVMIGDSCAISTDRVITCGSHSSDSTFNHYYYNRNDGHDILATRYYNDSVLVFGEGLDSRSLKFIKSGLDLKIVLSDTESVTLFQYFWSIGAVDSSNVEFNVQFASAAPQNLLDLVHINGLMGTEGNDVFAGTSDDDNISGLAGDDSLQGGDGNDSLDGGAGADVIFGREGSDVLIGGTGNDVLIGNYANYDASNGTCSNSTSDQDLDRYQFALNDGQDLICEWDSNGMNGILEFGSGISPDNLTLEREGNNLVIHVSDSDIVTVDRWFESPGYRLSQFIFTGQEPVNATEFVDNGL